VLDDFLYTIDQNKQIMQRIASQQRIPYLELEASAFPDAHFYDYCHLRPAGERIKAQLIKTELLSRLK
jgi:hypothetical protein